MGEAPEAEISHSAQKTVRGHSRAIRILTFLQSDPGLNARQLAQRLNVSRRTIFRDLNLIRNAGIQVYFDEEHDAYRLAPESKRTIPTSVGDVDLEILTVAACLSQLQSLPQLARGIRDSLTKLLARYPADVRDSIRRLMNSCEVRDPAWSLPSATQTVLSTIFQAVRQQRKLRISFRQQGRSEYTTLGVERLIAAGNQLYLIGQSSAHGQVRSFAVRDIDEAELTGELYSVSGNQGVAP